MLPLLIVSTLLCCNLIASTIKGTDDNAEKSSCCGLFSWKKSKKEPEYCATLTAVKPKTDSANKYNSFEELEKTIITLRRCIKHHDFTLGYSAVRCLGMQLILFLNDNDSIENLKHIKEICTFLEDLSILFENTKKMDYETIVTQSKVSFSHMCRLTSKISSPLVATKTFFDDIESIYSVAEQSILLYERLEQGMNIKLIAIQDKYSKFTFTNEKHPFYMRRVLHHLLKNAIKSTKTIDSPYILLHLSVFSDRSKHRCRFTITDNGIGIPDNVRENWHKSQYDQKTGLGFWLYTCKNLVTEMNGTISFISEIGRGTTFLVDVPCMVIEE